MAESNNNKANHQSQQSLMFTYLKNSMFYQELRLRFPSIVGLSNQQKSTLVLSAQLIRFTENDKIVQLNVSQQKIFLILHGEIQFLNGKYSKGQCFYSHAGELQQNPQIQTRKRSISKFERVVGYRFNIKVLSKTSALCLSKQHFQRCLHNFEEYYKKKQILEKMFSQAKLEKFGNAKKMLKQLAKKMKIENVSQNHGQLIPASLIYECQQDNKEKAPIQQSGDKQSKRQSLSRQANKKIYFLLQGSFMVFKNRTNHISQIESTYFGQEILWKQQYDYNFKLKTLNGQVAYITKYDFLTIATKDFIGWIKKNYEIKLMLRDKYKNNPVRGQIEAKKISNKDHFHQSHQKIFKKSLQRKKVLSKKKLSKQTQQRDTIVQKAHKTFILTLSRLKSYTDEAFIEQRKRRKVNILDRKKKDYWSTRKIKTTRDYSDQKSLSQTIGQKFLKDNYMRSTADLSYFAKNMEIKKAYSAEKQKSSFTLTNCIYPIDIPEQIQKASSKTFYQIKNSIGKSEKAIRNMERIYKIQAQRRLQGPMPQTFR